MPTELEKELEFYIAKQKNLVKKYEGKFIVIKNERVIGIYDTELEAYKETQRTHPLGTFLIQKVEAGADNYTQTFHSRVSAL